MLKRKVRRSIDMIHQSSRCTNQNVNFAGSPLKTGVGKVEGASSEVFQVYVRICLFANDLRLLVQKGMLSGYCTSLTERKE